MTIAELIKELKKYKNLDATVHIVYGNDDYDLFDRTDFELFSDKSEDDYIDLFISKENV